MQMLCFLHAFNFVLHKSFVKMKQSLSGFSQQQWFSYTKHKSERRVKLSTYKEKGIMTVKPKRENFHAVHIKKLTLSEMVNNLHP